MRLFSYKFKLQLPKKKKYIIFPSNDYKYFIQYLGKKNFFLIKPKEVYVPVVIKILFSLNFFNLRLKYYSSLISKVQPKFVITLNSTDENFYQLKNYFRKAKYIAIQRTSMFTEYKRLFKFDNKTNNCDYLLQSHNDHKINNVKKIINIKKLINIGSFINNYNYRLRRKKNFCLIILRSGPTFHSQSEVNLLKQLSIYIQEKKIKKFDILLKNKINKSMEDYFKKNFKKEELNNFNIIWRKGLNNFYDRNKSYNLASSYKNIIFDRSTMGFEMMSKKSKCICISSSKEYEFDFCLLNKKFVETFNPAKEFKNLFFYTKFESYDQLKKKLDAFFKTKTSNWYKSSVNINKIWRFDKDNQIFRELIKDN